MKKNVALIIPYFGKFPNYFDFWLKSAKYNNKFDFLIFTDNDSYNTKGNVKFIHMSFDKFKALLQEQVQFPICLDEPYKLCDYRPMYGSALHYYIKDYKFWGFCDVDLIFGDMSKFITPKILGDYDKIYQLGHLTLLRNNEICDNLWKEKHHLNNAYRYDEAFKTPYACHFDETNGLTRISELRKIKTYSKVDFADIDRKQFNFHLLNREEKIHAGVFEWKNGNLVYMYIKNGKVISQEVIYAHFQKRKLSIERYDNVISDSFIIVPNKILVNYNLSNILSEQKITQKYEYYRSSRRIEIIKSIKKHAIQQRVYRSLFRPLFRKWVLDKQ
ncbi:DUF6625 family protein [Lactobacillus helveticus]|uniref:DUF6625 family protein n=1 Tax=Lactobacillus helveticus TaxID=1587 RepID=UPI001562E25B|nr:DUF6625 family protein [Lactobacillus helveticus]NRO29213.1 hypothetical protein [Lactobacillus helveticus]